MEMNLAFVGVALLMVLVELRRPGRSWPSVPGWAGRVALLTGIQLVLVLLYSFVLGDWMARYRLWSVESLGSVWGTLIGFLAITFASYWWHRLKHDVPFLWRWLHQVHHSPQRIELMASFYRSPLEILINTTIMSVVAYMVVGISPGTASSVVLLLGVMDMFYHWNVRTPRWLGWILQRPESHCVHHAVGVHAFNYGDIPLWDQIFGTFRNPREFRGRCGFGPDEERLGEMLAGRDLSGGGPRPAR